MNWMRPGIIGCLLCAAVAAAPGGAGDLEAALKRVRAVGAEGQGNAAASEAWQRLASVEAARLPDLLRGMTGVNDYAANWILLAADAVASRSAKLPLAELGQVVCETRNHPRARRFAFETIAAVDPVTGDRLLAGMLTDPGADLRRLAVDRVMTQARQAADGGNKSGAVLLYQQALAAGREADQLEAIGKQLAELGRPVDLPRLFGFLTRWRVIGPFDNTKNAGFDAAYPPEQSIDLQAEYDGKSGKVKWVELVSTNEFGIVDINKAFGELKEVTAYAYGEFEADTARAVELRLGCKNAWKVWLNGKLLFGRDEYHMGMEIDQYRLPATLVPGRNRILVKLGQNEMKEDWTVEWQFQLRITDSLGTPVEPVALAAAQP